MTDVEQPRGSAVTPEGLPKAAIDLHEKRKAVANQLGQLVRRAESAAKDSRRWGQRWSRLYFIVGLPAAILAAVAGATALASTAGRVPAGIIALVSAGLTAAATFLDSATRETSYDNLAAGWQVLCNDALLSLDVDLRNDQWLVQKSRAQLQDFLNRERKLLQGKAPDAEAEAERRAQLETLRAQAEATRAEAEAERARAAVLLAQTEARDAAAGRALAASLQADEAAMKNQASKLDQL